SRARRVDETEEYAWDNVDTLLDAGFMGMTIPKAYGGLGRSYLDAVLVIEQMAQCCGAAGRMVVEANMGAISAIMAYGSDEQKRLAAAFPLAGDKPAICITEPSAGSAATEMTTRAVKHGDTYIINGRKHWITGGGVSRLHLVFARTFDDKGEEQGIAGFIAVRGETKGLVIGKREPAMGLRGIPETEILFEDMEVPADMMLVPPSGLRHGFGDLIDAYNGQRVGAGTVALGLAQGSYDLAIAYLHEREQFGRPIAEFQGLQWMIADLATGIEASRGLIYRAARSKGDRAGLFPDPVMAAQAKLFTSEMAVKVTNDVLQLHGAWGYSRNCDAERYVRDARMFTIAGGTAQMLRTLIAGGELDMKIPQTRDGFVELAKKSAKQTAAA
ncbi:MAG: acyl-CoA dehydrogenase family protein, partial [Alphaproteobacteria bacterium]|nr:acyl-CoA dehydrogenase family protein [Alphaproteobacteria bacterium]